MQTDTKNKQLTSILTPLSADLGVELWGIELILSSPKHRVVRIFIDRPEGVDIDTCAEFSRHADLILDVEDIIPGTYTLEVSSPGLDRTFFSPGQLDGFLGKEVKLTLTIPRDGRKNFKGILTSRTADRFTLTLEDASVPEFCWDEVRKLKLVFSG